MDNNLPKRIYSGTVNIAGNELGCAVLDDETRVLTSTAVFFCIREIKKRKIK